MKNQSWWATQQGPRGDAFWGQTSEEFKPFWPLYRCQNVLESTTVIELSLYGPGLP